MPLALAASTSGFDLSIAVETTTQVAPSTFAAACQACTWYPSAASIASVGDASASLPLTRLPRVAKILANADIPDPPIPTKCGRLVSTGAIGPVGQVMVLLSVMCPPGKRNALRLPGGIVTRTRSAKWHNLCESEDRA